MKRCAVFQRLLNNCNCNLQFFWPYSKIRCKLLHVKRIETNECGLAAASYCYDRTNTQNHFSIISLSLFLFLPLCLHRFVVPMCIVQMPKSKNGMEERETTQEMQWKEEKKT